MPIAAFVTLTAIAVAVATPSEAQTTRPRPTSNDVVDVAVAAGNFTTLVKAIQAAGLVQTLKDEGPFTVFAPSDSAFARLPAGTIEALLADRARLTAVLTYHVVPGRLLATQVAGLRSARTVNGQNVTIKVENGKVFVDGAQVTATDILASNGVIHVIDAVILPRN